MGYKDAHRKTYYLPKWAKKRAIRKHKGYKTFNEFWAEVEVEYGGKSKEEQLTEQMEEFEFASA